MPDDTPAKQEKPRPHQHLSVEELRRHEHITAEEWFEELEARGILVPASDKPGPPPPFPKIAHRPGVLARFLRERA